MNHLTLDIRETFTELLANLKDMSKRLPAPWKYVETLENADGVTQSQIEQFLGMPKLANPVEYRWDKLVNEKTGDFAIIKVANPKASESIISAVFFVSSTGQQLGSEHLRSFPIASVTQAYIDESNSTDFAFRAMLNAGSGYNIDEAIERTNDDKFYARIALQYNKLDSLVEGNAVKNLAELNRASKQTAQRWLKEARNREFLPPVQSGRPSGKK